MKFQIKLFIITFVIVSAGFCLGGTLLIIQNFNYSLDSQIEQISTEHYMLRYFYDAQLKTEMSKASNQESFIKAATYVARSFSWSRLTLCISDVNKNHIYSNMPQDIGRLDIIDTLIETPNYKIIKTQNNYYIITTSVTAGNYITSASDISAVYTELSRQTQNMIITNGITLAVLGVALFILSAYITRPIKALSKAAKRISDGNYKERVAVRGNDEVAALSGNFNKMIDSVEENILRLERYAKNRDEFVSNFSHEIKTPMTSIIGYAELLQMTECDRETTDESLGYIYSEGKRLETLSRRLLTLMKLKQSKAELEPAELAPVIEEITVSTRPACEKKEIKLTVSDYPKRVLFDKALLQMLLINLVHNAAAACSENGNIQILFEQSDTKCKISVTDDGCGIHETELAKITEEFYRVDKSRKNTEGNFGLGLSICREIALLHKSELVIESARGKGTNVWFEVCL